jgi:hypothetical protein
METVAYKHDETPREMILERTAELPGSVNTHRDSRGTQIVLTGDALVGTLDGLSAAFAHGCDESGKAFKRGEVGSAAEWSTRAWRYRHLRVEILAALGIDESHNPTEVEG